MTIVKRLLILLFLSANISILLAQIPGKISGKIYDTLGEALPGANIMVNGTSIGASSDINGNYAILNISPGTYTITASFMLKKAKVSRRFSITAFPGSISNKDLCNLSPVKDLILVPPPAACPRRP